MTACYFFHSWTDFLGLLEKAYAELPEPEVLMKRKSRPNSGNDDSGQLPSVCTYTPLLTFPSYLANMFAVLNFNMPKLIWLLYYVSELTCSWPKLMTLYTLDPVRSAPKVLKGLYMVLYITARCAG